MTHRLLLLLMPPSSLDPVLVLLLRLFVSVLGPAPCAGAAHCADGRHRAAGAQLAAQRPQPACGCSQPQHHAVQPAAVPYPGLCIPRQRLVEDGAQHAAQHLPAGGDAVKVRHAHLAAGTRQHVVVCHEHTTPLLQIVAKVSSLSRDSMRAGARQASLSQHSSRTPHAGWLQTGTASACSLTLWRRLGQRTWSLTTQSSSATCASPTRTSRKPLSQCRAYQVCAAAHVFAAADRPI